jgi:6-O-methylguanine DNA methyltransferase, ribonuclease-like domain
MKHDPNIVYAECSSAQGNLYLAATERGLAGMWFTDQRHLPDVSAWKQVDNASQQRVLKETQQQLQAYFAGKLQQFDVPLDLSAGTTFQQSVWQALLAIPFEDSFWQNHQLWRFEQQHRQALGGSRRRHSHWAQPDWHYRALPSGDWGGRLVDRVRGWFASKRGLFNPRRSVTSGSNQQAGCVFMMFMASIDNCNVMNPAHFSSAYMP